MDILVNFKQNLSLPRHSWFNIKEGYSSLLVSNIIDELNITDKDLVLDPFSGSGTTVLHCALNNIESIGIEVNPFLHFLSKNKSLNFKKSLKEIRKSIVNIDLSESYEEPLLSISKKLFGGQLKQVLQLKKYISNINDIKVKNFLHTAFLCSLDSCSYAKKDGNGLRYPKNKKPKDIILEFNQNAYSMLDDIEKTCTLRTPRIINNNTLKEITKKSFKKQYSNKLSLIMFSPPYANCFDYTEVYKTELWFGDFIKNYSELKVLRNKSMSSHLNKDFANIKSIELVNYINKLINKKLWSKKIIPMLNNYFVEFELLLENLYDLLKKEKYCIIVVGNSSYGNCVIPTDIIITNIATRIGYSSAKINVVRKLGTSSQQYKKVDKPDLLRESIIYLQK